MHYTHRPCFALAISFAVGIWLGTFLSVSWGWAFGLMPVCLAGMILKHDRASVVCLYGMFALVGFIHAQSAQILPAGHVAHLRYDERRDMVLVEGVITSDVDVRTTQRGTKTVFEMDVESISGRPKSGKVMVNIFRRESLNYGQRIVLSGKLHKPFPGSTSGHFSYEDYLKRNGIYWMLSVRKDAEVQIFADGQGSPFRAFALRSRHQFKGILDQHLNDLEAGVIQSLVLGGRYYIPDSVRQVFVETGTAHILAISGMNIGSIVLLVVIMLGVIRIPRTMQLVLTIVLLAAYCYFTGANPSVVRATVMAIVFLGGCLAEREQEALNSLGLSAMIILLFDPLSLFDIGFQLSFAGVFSIIVLYPRVYSLCAGTKTHKGHRAWTIMMQALCLSLAAWIGVAPLIAYYFQIVTPVTILANVPIVPFVSALMMLGIGLMAAGLFSPWLASCFAACVKAVLVVMMLIIESFNRIPFSHWPMKDVTHAGMIMYYCILFLVFFWIDRKRTSKPAGDHAHFLS